MLQHHSKMYCFSSEHNNCFRIIVFMCVFCFRRICASDFFIAKQYGKDNYVCVTNSSFAMSWVQENITTPLSHRSFFTSRRNKNNFDSSILLGNPKITSFSRSSWFPFLDNIILYGLILDRRWEELDTYVTKFVEERGTVLNYIKFLSQDLKDDFAFRFSIRLKQEGHVFLCDGEYPPNSNCYWFMLQAWGGNKTAIRKCSKGYIPYKHREHPEPPCSNILKELDHTNKPESLYISNQKWSHLKITRKGNVLSLFSVNNKKEEKNIMNLEDQKPIINLTNIIIHSKKFNGLWKFHKRKVFFTKQVSTKIYLGNLTNLQDNYLCINLFTAMCTYCSMVLTLEDSRNNTIEEKVYKLGPGWSEIKFITKNIKQDNKPVKFLVSTSSSSNDRYWIIDDIRICQREEFRVIALTENAKCQLLSAEDDVISLSTNVQRLDSHCSEHTIGDFCVPCNWVFDSCERVEVCQKDKCVCSAGYRSSGGRYYPCHDECDSSYYGHGCLKQCSTCWNSTCNHIDGTCTSYNSNNFFILLCLLLVLPLSYYIFRKYKLQRNTVSFQNTGRLDKFLVQLSTLETLQRNMNEDDHQNQELNLLEKRDSQNCTLQPSKVQTETFYSYVKTSESCGLLKRQHETIMETLTTYEILLDDFQEEYVDMKYPRGDELRKVYIATQIPKKSQLNHFWKILWDKNVRHIVLFDNISNDAHELQYWPDENESMRLGNIFIKCRAPQKYEFYTCRTFTVISKGQKRRINQLHFSSNSIEHISTIKYVNFFQEISNISLDTNSPILIHSSCGMSGNCLVLLCDISLRSATRDGVVDVMTNFRNLTELSPHLIVNYDHYLLAHRIISEGVLHIKTSIDCTSLESNEPFYIGSDENGKLLKYLQKTSWLDCHFGCSQPIIHIYSVISSNHECDSDQISKISIHGFESPGKFLVTPHLSIDIANHFWKQIDEGNISVIISLNGNVSAWPRNDVSSMQLSSGITIKKTNHKQFSTFEWISVEMNNRNIEIFSIKNWPDKLIHPHNVCDFVNFCMETNELLDKHQFIAVTCHDDLTPAGLYITMSYNMQKIKKEGVSDICSCIRIIRSQCQHFLNYESSYKFLMKATHRYMEEFKLYEVR